MYSAHDSNLASVITALNFSNYECLMDKFFNNTNHALNCVDRPYYAASIIFELHLINGQY